MLRKFGLFLTLLLTLSACATGPGLRLGPDGRPLPRVYRIRSESKVEYRMLDSVNVLRQAAGVSAVELDSRLNAAAATHSRDMSIQNRPWHFGSDGSSPLDRVARVGYRGVMLGENISETYETELETLAAWMDRDDTRDVILHPEASRMGFAWHQDPNGKIWWTLIMGAEEPEAPETPDAQG